MATSPHSDRVLTNALLVAALSVLGATACIKEKPTTVVITVKDADGDVGA
jgi:hypothetical protein